LPHIAETVLEAAGIGGWELDVAIGRLAWTAITFEIYELDPPHAPPVADALTFYPPEARPVVQAAMQAAIDAGTPWDIETPLVTARGRHRWVRSWGLAVREGGRTVRLVGAFQDVTDRRAANARTERLSIVASQMTNIVITTDRRGRIDWVNAALTRLTGYTLADALGRAPSDLLQGPRTDPATIRRMERGVADGTGFDVEVVSYTKAGLPFWTSITCSPLRAADGTVNGFISVQADISARRAAEDAARAEAAERQRAELLLRDVLETLPTGVSVFDADNRFVLANRAYREMFPATAGFLDVGRELDALMRLGLAHGQYGDVAADEAGREAWIARHLAYFRSPTGIARRQDMADGRVIQVRERRSDTGMLVSVRTDMTDLHKAEARARNEAAERARADALLRDVVAAVPSAIVAYDHDERLILTNQADAERMPLPPTFSALGERLEDVVRLAVSLGLFPDAPAAAAEHEAWIAQLLAYLRDSRGAPRTLSLKGGRSIQVRARRSGSGNLVIIRTDITDLLRAQALLHDVLEAMPSAVVAYDPDDRVILANQTLAEMAPMLTGVSDVAMRLSDVLRLGAEGGYFADLPAAPAARDLWLGELLAYFRNTGGVPRTLRVSDGHSVQVRARRSATGNLVVVSTDITAQTRAEALLRDILEALPSAVIAYDRDERLLLWNRAASTMLPASAGFAAVGRTLEEMIRFSAASSTNADVGATAAEHDRWIAAELAAYRASSGARTQRMRDGRFLTALERRSESGNLVCVRTDTTDLKRAEQHLRWQAERDPLTQLHNRTFFLTALEQALAAVAGSTAQGFVDGPMHGNRDGGVLLVLDIDYFKQINDTLGHDMGDALLVEIAARLRVYLRGGGEGAARLGGDEFGVVIPGLADQTAVMARIDGLHAALSAPADLGGRRTPVGISMGATMFPADGTDATKLLKNADLALYEAKRNGRGRWTPFRPEQATALERHARMADALREALSRQLFTVALQPKRRLRGGSHAGFEALARWHDGADWVPPGDFIPVAEDTGLIQALGRAVMAATFARIREIRDQGLEPGRVALNVTGPQLLDPHFKEQTLSALRRHGLGPADLELELTGTALFGSTSERLNAVLRDMSTAGITLALDNFGTGSASLAHLWHLPIDRLKIDRAFVAGIGGAGPGGAMARTVISLARSLGMESIAKGVETAEQMAFLVESGCDVAQGYLISPALLTTADAAAYLGTTHRLSKMAHSNVAS
jgi:diguanylate cyclase (GGDEF)-like protein/PAS domain S-box-containing protein